jgi:hypothetical protein
MNSVKKLLLSPYDEITMKSETPLSWSFTNCGPGIAHVECHNGSAGPMRDLLYVQAHGALLSAGQHAVFSGVGPISLTSVDDEGATMIVELEVT